VRGRERKRGADRRTPDCVSRTDGQSDRKKKKKRKKEQGKTGREKEKEREREKKRKEEGEREGGRDTAVADQLLPPTGHLQVYSWVILFLSLYVFPRPSSSSSSTALFKCPLSPVSALPS
jgi:hypothetical protein